jgi:hypothetical protein
MESWKLKIEKKLTNLVIWKALSLELEGKNTKIINKRLQSDLTIRIMILVFWSASRICNSSFEDGKFVHCVHPVLKDGGNCTICSSSENSGAVFACIRETLKSFNLNTHKKLRFQVVLIQSMADRFWMHQTSKERARGDGHVWILLFHKYIPWKRGSGWTTEFQKYVWDSCCCWYSWN